MAGEEASRTTPPAGAARSAAIASGNGAGQPALATVLLSGDTGRPALVRTSPTGEIVDEYPRASVEIRERTADEDSEDETDNHSLLSDTGSPLPGPPPALAAAVTAPAALPATSPQGKGQLKGHPKEQTAFDARFPELPPITAALAHRLPSNVSWSLLDYYSCTYEGEVNARGKLYITPTFFCFYGKYFTKVAKVILLWDDVSTVEKLGSTLKPPSNLRLVDVQGFKYVFSGFYQRDRAYQATVEAWKAAVKNQESLHINNAAHSGADQPPRSAQPRPTATDSSGSRRDSSSTDERPVPALPSQPANGSPRLEPSSAPPPSASDSATAISPFHAFILSVGDKARGKDAEGAGGAADPLSARKASVAGQAADSPAAILKGKLTHARQRSTSEGRAAAAATASQPSTVPSKPDAGKPDASVPHHRHMMSMPEFAAASTSPKIGPVSLHTHTHSEPTLASSPNLGPPMPSTPFPPPSDCGCAEHLSTTLTKTEFAVRPQALFLAIFGEDESQGQGAPWVAAQKQRSSDALRPGTRWERKPDAHEGSTDPAAWARRELDYFVKAPMFPRTPCHEEQVLSKVAVGCYVVDTTVRTPKVPLGDTFTVLNRYCITSLGDGNSQLLLTSSMVMTKRSILASQIERTAMDGQADYSKKLVTELHKQFANVQPSRPSSRAGGSVSSASPATPGRADATGPRVPRGQAAEDAEPPPASLTEQAIGFILGWVGSLFTEAPRKHRKHDGLGLLALVSLVGVIFVATSVTFTSVYWASITNSNLERTMMTLALTGNRIPMGAHQGQGPAYHAAPRKPQHGDNQQGSRLQKIADLRDKLEQLQGLVSELEAEVRALAEEGGTEKEPVAKPP